MDLICFKEIVEYNDIGNNMEVCMGWLGCINYSFVDCYLIELIGCWDGFWKFKLENCWGFFFFVFLGWRIFEENFWKESKIVNVFFNLKICGLYGVVGDDNVSDYVVFDYLFGYKYNNGGVVLDGDWVVGIEICGLFNKILLWMEFKILDIGVDMGFFNNCLNVQVDFFQCICDGIFEFCYDVLILNEVGFFLLKENLRLDKYVGFDVMVNWIDYVSDFNYSVGVNMIYLCFWDWE